MIVCVRFVSKKEETPPAYVCVYMYMEVRVCSWFEKSSKLYKVNTNFICSVLLLRQLPDKHIGCQSLPSKGAQTHSVGNQNSSPLTLWLCQRFNEVEIKFGNFYLEGILLNEINKIFSKFKR